MAFALPATCTRSHSAVPVKGSEAEQLEEDVEVSEECWSRRASARLRQIKIGKARPEYQWYDQAVPAPQRLPHHPVTPDPYARISKRSFDRQLSQWRRSLHDFDASMLPDNEPSTSSNSRQSQSVGAGLSPDGMEFTRADSHEISAVFSGAMPSQSPLGPPCSRTLSLAGMLRSPVSKQSFLSAELTDTEPVAGQMFQEQVPGMPMLQTPAQLQTTMHANAAGRLQTCGAQFFSPYAPICHPFLPMPSVVHCPNAYLWAMAATQTACSWMPPPVPSTGTMEGTVTRLVEGPSSLGSTAGAPVASGMALRSSDDLVPSQPSMAPCSLIDSLGLPQPAPSTPKRRELSPWSGSQEHHQPLQAEPRTPPARSSNSPQNRVGTPGSLPSTGPRTPALDADRIEHLKLGRTPSPETQYRPPSSYSSATPASMQASLQFSPFQPLPPPMHSVLGGPSTPSAGPLAAAGTPLESFNSVTPPSFFPPCRLGPHIVTPTPPVPFATPPQMRPGRQSQGLTPGPVRHPGLPPTQLDYSAAWVERKPC
eukprot:TRINITY_DN46123_c0_g1_i1.p1 TRINITY_DN46123_c0_g1~~TRINITY_DN46123_c0_g1_i1.p1  ORF type:complete len:537 (+),score=61.01 TRINITY_DN46123_c0_g1_i1:43-1653(+)